MVQIFRAGEFIMPLMFMLAWGFGISTSQAQQTQADSIRELLSQTKDDSLRFGLYRKLFSFYTLFNPDSAWSAGNQLAQIAKRSGSDLQQGTALDMMGRARLIANRLSEAVDYFDQAKQFYTQAGALDEVYILESLIARTYLASEDYPAAGRALKKAYDHFDGLPETVSGLVNICIRYAMYYEKINKPDSMLYYAQRASNLADELQLENVQTALQNNLAAGYAATGQHEKALSHFRNVLILSKERDQSSLDHAAYGMAITFRELNEPDSVIKYGLLTAHYAKQVQDVENQSAGHEFAATGYYEKKDFARAYQELAKAKELGDSTYKLWFERDLADYRVKYETEEKEKTIALQELELLRTEQRRRNALITGLGLFLLGSFGFLIYRNQVVQKKKDLDLQLANEKYQKEQLAQIDQLRTNFFANVSHEFRTPLTLVLNPLRDYQAGLLDSIEPFLPGMIHQGERMTQLIQQLLDLTKLDHGIIELNAQPIALYEWIQVIIQSFESWALKETIHFNYAVPDDDGLIVDIDQHKWETILINVLSNALKHTPENGRIRIQSTWDVRNDQGVFRFHVNNQPSHLTEEERLHLFDRFFTKGSDGLGIGLALTKEWTEVLNGTIEVESSTEEGTTFSIELPFQVSETKNIHHGKMPDKYVITDLAGPAVMPALTKSDPQLETVLLVEDNQDLLYYVQRHLAKYYHVIMAKDGEEGFQKAILEIPDLIITDVMMPKLDGFEMSAKIRENEKTNHIPIIMLTAKADHTDKLQSISYGIDSFLSKPFSTEELQLRIKALLDQRERLRQKFAKSVVYVPTEQVENNPVETFIDKAVGIIIDNLDDEDFNSEVLATKLLMSKSQLYRKLKALTDQSPAIFIRNVRLQKAHELLEVGKGNISEVTAMVGIPNLAYFSRCFSARFGFPPSELLKRG